MRRPLRALLALTTLTILACGTRAFLPPATFPPNRTAAAPREASARGPRLPSGPLPIRLGLATDQTSIELLGSAQQRIVLRRAGSMVLSSDGRSGRTLEVTGPIQVDGKRYPGRLRVEANRQGGLDLLNLVALEDYVAGVVAAELSLWSARPAELEAQAIAVRTYALRTLATRQAQGAVAELVDGVEDQAYRGSYQPAASAGARRAAARLATAVAATRSLVLLEGNDLADVRYHAACGGTTANRATIFPGTLASPLRSCTPCQLRAKQEAAAGMPDTKRPLGWTLELGFGHWARLGHALGLGTDGLRLEPATQDDGGRWLRARVTSPIGQQEIDLEELRLRLGRSAIKSGVLTDWRTTPAGLRITGRGRGHGVGLCQEGTRDYAIQGWTAQRILHHYYPAMRLERLAL